MAPVVVPDLKVKGTCQQGTDCMTDLSLTRVLRDCLVVRWKVRVYLAVTTLVGKGTSGRAVVNAVMNLLSP
jgi:hypothetical protein